MILEPNKKLNLKKNLFVNFLAIYGLGTFKISKIFRLLGVSSKEKFSKIESKLKISLMKLVKQNYIYSRDHLKRKKILKVNYLRKIKSFRGYYLN